MLRKYRMKIIVVVVCSLFGWTHAVPILIGAFNIQVFGVSKMGKPEVVDTLAKIVQRYDILLIQEIRDRFQNSFPQLVAIVNEASSVPYSFVISPRTGRSRSKEQYGFIYRTDVVSVNDEYQYEDRNDTFERDPYAVQFERVLIQDAVQRTFTYVAIHVKPSDAIEEINALDDVYDNIAHIFGEVYDHFNSVVIIAAKDALIGGDLNADCRYICKRCFNRLDLWNDPRFTWLIDSDADTTVKSTDCAYDRLVVAGNSMTANSGPGRVFRFDLAYNLTIKMAEKVSDHYPVEFYLN